jgi:hypothetical protein
MLDYENINQRVISLAESVTAEVLYDISMVVNFSEFYLLKLKKNVIEQSNLNYNLYKYKIQ